ncbi:MAG: hypothetical protein MK078_11230 [Crocinitomicaceae bacterium]|nr:hypothetical protein [Crocinitomicaceae bacterium]
MWRLIWIKLIFVLLSFIGKQNTYAQFGWTWTEMEEMPIPISNNAVTTGSVAGEIYLYSFGGIDSTKIFSGITQNSFRYRVSDDTWEEIAPLPTDLPLIASAASNVKNRIYIIGGYNVDASGHEISSNEVIIYDPESNLYVSGGESIPVPIDDHVQCVWRDSLIYVITGWSNTTNINNVQIYNPSLNTWSEGTEVPNHVNYKVFGGSGTIIGDTIYYYSGATTSTSFSGNKKIRMGIINPDDPTEIEWSLLEDGPNKKYRAACVNYGEKLFWIGGSERTYNYDGLGYDDGTGVPPHQQILTFNTADSTWEASDEGPIGVMDLRGIGQIASSIWIICGGMTFDQEVSNKTYMIQYDPVVVGIEENKNTFNIIDRTIQFSGPVEQVKIYGLDGSLLSLSNSPIIPEEIYGMIIVELTPVSGPSIFKKAVLF